MIDEDGFYILYTEREKIQSHAELRERLIHGQLSEDRFKRIMLHVTGSEEQAELAAAKFVAEKVKLSK